MSFNFLRYFLRFLFVCLLFCQHYIRINLRKLPTFPALERKNEAIDNKGEFEEEKGVCRTPSLDFLLDERYHDSEPFQKKGDEPPALVFENIPVIEVEVVEAVETR